MDVFQFVAVADIFGLQQHNNSKHKIKHMIAFCHCSFKPIGKLYSLVEKVALKADIVMAEELIWLPGVSKFCKLLRPHSCASKRERCIIKTWVHTLSWSLFLSVVFISYLTAMKIKIDWFESTILVQFIWTFEILLILRYKFHLNIQKIHSHARKNKSSWIKMASKITLFLMKSVQDPISLILHTFSFPVIYSCGSEDNLMVV